VVKYAQVRKATLLKASLGGAPILPGQALRQLAPAEASYLCVGQLADEK
jgi:hypothetical protein